MLKPFPVQEKTFRTSLKPSKKNNNIDYDSTIVLFGSCFSENIGKKLDYFRFDSLTNPYGILFNPIVMKRALQECIDRKKYTSEDLFYFNEQYHSYNLHSTHSNSNANIFIQNINLAISKTNEKLKKASHVIITLGTASVYKLIESNKTVANCHKVPQNKFTKELLSTEEIATSLKDIIQKLKSINKHVEIIFTVSPIRHLKDGIIENSRSKANLISAIHYSLTNNCHYFPSYEIMNDDLRDYRFYEGDMIHPNQTAIDYIWEFFKEEWLSSNIEPILKEVDTVRKGKLHRAFDSNSKNHINFLKKLKEKEANLKKDFNIIL